MNEITKYQNRLNTVNFTGFGKVNSNLFFAICTKVRGHEENSVRFTFSEIRKLADFSNHSNEALVTAIDNTYSDMIKLDIRMDANDNSGDYTKFTLFHRFDVLLSEQAVEVRATPELKEILNDFTGEWTAFKLEEYINLKSTYSKHMYRLLKQWRTLGGHTWKVEDWRNLLEIPESYTMTIINKRVLKPILVELPAYFKGLSLEKIKSGRGNKVIAIKFIFQPEDNNYTDLPENEYLKSKEHKIDDLNKQIEKDKSDGNLQKEVEHTALRDQIKTENDWMNKNDIPDTPKKSLFERFFSKRK